MEARELRIGNWVKFNNLIQPEQNIKINARWFSSLAGGRSIDEMKDNEELNGYWHPIPLTPERLQKAGFVKYQWNDSYFIKTKFGDLMIQFYKTEIHLFFTNVRADREGMKFNGRRYIGNVNSTQNIKYLHQLQNLHFALTGEELEIEL